MINSMKELIKEVAGFLKADGYRVVGVRTMDYDKTVKLVVIKDGVKGIVPLVECFYDTDAKGKMTKFHGVVSITETPWYKKKRRRAG